MLFHDSPSISVLILSISKFFVYLFHEFIPPRMECVRLRVHSAYRRHLALAAQGDSTKEDAKHVGEVLAPGGAGGGHHHHKRVLFPLVVAAGVEDHVKLKGRASHEANL